jgi:hypothetical protein
MYIFMCVEGPFTISRVKKMERVMKKCRACKISGSQMTFSLFSKNTFTKSCAKKLERVMKKCRACKISGSQMTFLLFSKNTFDKSCLLKNKSLFVTTQA